MLQRNYEVATDAILSLYFKNLFSLIVTDEEVAVYVTLRIDIK